MDGLSATPIRHDRFAAETVAINELDLLDQG